MRAFKKTNHSNQIHFVTSEVQPLSAVIHYGHFISHYRNQILAWGHRKLILILCTPSTYIIIHMCSNLPVAIMPSMRWVHPITIHANMKISLYFPADSSSSFLFHLHHFKQSITFDLISYDFSIYTVLINQILLQDLSRKTGLYLTPSLYGFTLHHGLVTSTSRGQPRFLEYWRQPGWSWSCVIVKTKRGGHRSGMPREAVTIRMAKQDAEPHNHLQLNVDSSYGSVHLVVFDFEANLIGIKSNGFVHLHHLYKLVCSAVWR